MADVKELQKQMTKMMNMMKEERRLRELAETRLAEAQLAAIAAAANQPQPAKKALKLAMPNKFDGTKGNKAEAYYGQVAVYISAHPDAFPDDRTKLIFATTLLTGEAASWAQPTLEKLVNEEPATYLDFRTAFKCMYFDTEKKVKAERALRTLKQTKTVSHYTSQFSQYGRDSRWEQKTLMSHYKQGLKREVRMVLLLSRAEFETLEGLSNFALKIDNELNGNEPASASAPSVTAPDPNAMDLSAMRGQLSEADKTRMMRAGLCYRCGTKGHMSRDCLEKGGKGKGREKDVKIAELQDEVKRLMEEKDAGVGGRADQSKNGASKILTRNELDPCLYVQLNVTYQPNPRATSQPIKSSALFLIDSGATHDVVSKRFTESTRLISQATPTERTISGFDGSKSRSGHEILLCLDNERVPNNFIITKLKDAYDGILGMPWIKRHGNLIDWTGHSFRASPSRIATALAVSSNPKKPPTGELEQARKFDEGVCVVDTITPPQCKLDFSPSPFDTRTASKHTPFLECRDIDGRTRGENWRSQGAEEPIAAAWTASSDPKTPPTGELGKARKFDEGVCVWDTLALPQCEFDRHLQPSAPVSAGKCAPLLEPGSTAIDAAKTSWSTSAQLAADQKAVLPKKSVEEMVPKRYHSRLSMFRKSDAQKLPPRRKYDFRVDLLPGAQPQASRIIPLSPAENQALDTLIKEGLEYGTIRRTKSPWAAPVLFTGKKDGNLRPCFDYRKLNAVTVKNKYPLPLTMDLVDSLLNADTFTKLDLRNTYGNLRVAEGNEEKLAFICRAGQFAPLTMPFGPTGAPGFFQYFIQDILLGRIGKDMAAYLDNIMVYTQKGTDHEAAVAHILETLSKHQLWLKPEKCEFSRTEVEYLGLLISCNRIRMDPTKVKAVTEWPAPTNVTELQRFIGFSNFYRRFIDHFPGTARPLHDLTRAKTQFVWDRKCNDAFKALKTAFTTAPVLKIANPYDPFILECDCSDFALGAVLSQVCNKDNELHPVAYLSRSLIKAEKNMKFSIRNLYTDHRNLESFIKTKQLTRRQARWAETMGCFDFEIIFRPGRQATKPDTLSRRPDLAPSKEDKLTFGQLLRPENITPSTFAEIAEFDEWFHDETVELEDAEHWFQIDILGVEEPEEYGEGLTETPDDQGSKTILSDEELISLIRNASQSDKRLTKLISACEAPSPAPIKDAMRRYTTRDGVLYNGGRIEVPSDNLIKTEILRSRHNSKLAGHPGRVKTLMLVKQSFTWPLLKSFVNRYVDGCASCQRVKPTTHKPFGLLEPLPIPSGPWTDICYDMITDLPESHGFDSVLTVIDRLMKMAHFLPCKKSMNAEKLADIMLRQVWKLHGTPKTIASDRGSVFLSQITRELNRHLGIRLQPSTAYHPRTDGQSEIANKAVEQYLRHFVQYRQDDWEPLLATAEFAYNNNDHTSTGTSPFKANYGFNPTFSGIPSSEQCIPVVETRLKRLAEVQEELQAYLEEAQEAMKNQFDKGATATPDWKVGEEVWLSSKNISTTRPSAKLDHKWLGPFLISERISKSAYKLTLPLSMQGVHPVFHVSILRKHTLDTIQDQRQAEPAPVVIEDKEEWEIEDILDCRERRKRREYLVSWKGFGPEDNSWEPRKNLANSKEALADFDKKFPDGHTKHKRSRRMK
ncbi:hypothetical protein MJO29_005982 [Puccinia striiformis f. sp. tritici]|nr:hypothetical protein MJO29_005982 [Puccinia striiformis f. sp. tritici]